MFLSREELLILVREDPERFVDLFLSLRDQVFQLQERVKELEARLSLNSSNSHKPPSSDGYQKPSPKSLRKSSGLNPGGQKGHPGKTLIAVADPDQLRVHSLSFCPCGADLSQVAVESYERRQVFELPTPKLEVIEHQSEIKVCSSCFRKVTAPFPQGVNSPVQYGTAFQSLLVYLKDAQLLPFKRISQLCSDLFGYPVSVATLESARKHCYENLEPFEEKLKELLSQADFLHADESGLRVEKKLSWIHVLSNSLLTFYGIHPKRGIKAIEAFEILTKYQGTLMHDCWQPYFKLSCAHALCNAHLLRELKFFGQEQKEQWASSLFDLLLQMNKTPQAKAFSTWKRLYRKLLLKGDLKHPEKVVPSPRLRGRLKKSKAQNLLSRLKIHQSSVLAFLKDPQIPFTNNQAERDIRMIKVQQKISGSFRTSQGAKQFARIRSYLSTVQKQKLNLFQSISSALKGQPFIPSLVPKGT